MEGSMKLNYKKTFFVGFAFFLISVFWQAYDTIIPKILTDKFGMAQSWSGVIMALDNILALFMLPLFGIISDRCKSKMGRRTPFVLFGTIVAVIGLLLLSRADNMQRHLLLDVEPNNPAAQETLYNANLEIKKPDGTVLLIQEKFTLEEFTSIKMDNEDGSSNPEYTDFVVPARQAFANQATQKTKTPLRLFIITLLITLIAMATFRSPAVALMPDVTIKPLRSKANAVINMMGAAGGIVVLLLGMVFKTGAARNAVMSYLGFFGAIAAVMITALLIFMLKVKEPKLVAEMEEESRRLGLEEDHADESGDKVLSKSEKKSLYLILASVVLWFFGYNAVISKYSIYASSVLNLDYNLTLMIATAAAILSFVPVGIVSSKLGRKKTILGGIVILSVSFLIGSFIRAGTSPLIMNILFASAGIGWASINVNSYPMVVELAKGGNVGRYTGFYYTASMAAQTVTPIISGMLMDKISFLTLFPYGAFFVALAFFTMSLTKHGDNKPAPVKPSIEVFDALD